MSITNKGVPLPEGVTLQDLQDNWDTALLEYTKARNKMRVLDATDRGDIWDIISKKFPEYQITPDTNYVSYVKDNIVASVYTVGRCASLMPRRKEDVKIVEDLNKALDSIWGILGVADYQLQAGERAALLNLGITQVGWSADIVGGTTNSWYKGDIVFKNIDPMNYMRDPFARDLDNSAYVMIFDDYHKTILQSDPDYARAIKGAVDMGMSLQDDYLRDINNPGRNKNYFKLVVHWVRVYDEKKGKTVIHEIHTIDNKFVLQVKEDIQPSLFPFAELYSSIPVKDPIGVSEPSKILSSSIVLNLLDGLIVTHGYKAQRPPRLISDSSGLNLRIFSKHGNDPDKTFIVNGDASKAVHYVSFPPLPPGMEQIPLRLAGSMERMSGIDAAYTGKDTGSILTTGGIDSMLAQATMRDTTRIRLYEAYTKRLTRLVIQYMIEFGDKRTYPYKSPTTREPQAVTLDLPKIPRDTLFNYSINIDAEIPKNKARLAASADAMLEKSMQYQANPEIITIEEWLQYQNYPQKDLILERLKADRNANMTEQVAQILSSFAGLIEQGMDPNQAMDMVVQQMQNPEAQGKQGPQM